MKRIANIVFYKFNGERPNMKQACIFYTDGTVKNTSYEEGLEACQEIVARYNVTSKAAFKGMINNQSVYVMSGREFEARFQSFISREDVQTSTELVPASKENAEMVGYQKVYKNTNNNERKIDNSEVTNDEVTGLNRRSVPANFARDMEEEIESRKNIEEPEETPVFENNNEGEAPIVNNFANTRKPVVNPADTDSSNGTSGNKEKADVRPVIIPPIVGNNGRTRANDNDNIDNSRRVANPINNEQNDDQLDNDFVNGLDENQVIPPVSLGRENNNNENNNPIEDEGLADEDDFEEENENSNSRAAVVVPPVNGNGKPSTDALEDEAVEDYELDSEEETNEDDIDSDIEDEFIDEAEKEEPKKENKIVSWFKRGIEKIKKWSLVKKITAVALAILMGLGLYSCSARQTKSGEMLNSNISNSQDLDISGLEKRGGHLFLIQGNNDYWNDYSFEELQKVTTNETQKETMKAAATTLEGFNNGFANAHVEEGKNIKAALTFDEMMALQQAYNSYTPEQIRAIFNGASIKSGDMSRAYRDANLQLMGAYVIETRENPVDMSGIINSEEGKAFYKKYQDLFLDAKEATGEDKLKKIELFYQEVRKDFPITDSVRTEGIAHADDYASIEPYKLSVTPIIAAAEIMFQNYEVDYTLKDGEIDFLNDLGLCNYADDTFTRIETITLTNPEDNKNPLYTQYRDSIIYMLMLDGNYYVDDEHRELTKLDAFQQQVNWHAFEGRWVYSSYTYYTTETHTETKTWTETETTTRVEETREEKPITDEAKEEVDKQIEEENEQARQEAEEEAEKNRQEMQEEADEEAERIEEEVKEDAADLEEKIEDANEQIQENNSDKDPSNDKPVNEEDLGHGVQFDEEHQDGNGNLNDSVENITTDPHGDETGNDFPDPNEMGAEFDALGEAMEDGTPKSAATDKNATRIKLTDEQIADLYIDYLSMYNNSNEKGYQYTK